MYFDDDYDEYLDYLESPEWKSLRKLVLGRACYRCERCRKAGPLEVHHKHYNTLYREKLCDLEALCLECHEIADRQREAKTRFERGLDTYATKKYGYNWVDYPGYDEAAEEFSEWLDSKGG